MIPPSTKQPNSRKCFVCGVENPSGLNLRFYETGPGEVTAEVRAPERFQGFPGVVHGGVVAAVLDEAAGRAVMAGAPTRFMYTAKLEVSYRQPTPVGVLLQLTGRVSRLRGRLARATAELRLPDGTLTADAEALLAEVPGPAVGAAKLEELGWKVYPD
jgi:acyl-coenzyme A thioesterase PaaI-like protein